MDIPRPENFNECYLYEGTSPAIGLPRSELMEKQS